MARTITQIEKAIESRERKIHRYRDNIKALQSEVGSLKADLRKARQIQKEKAKK